MRSRRERKGESGVVNFELLTGEREREKKKNIVLSEVTFFQLLSLTLPLAISLHRRTMPRPSVLLATLAALCLSSHASAVAVTNAPSAITVNARGCSAVELTGLNSKFSYEAALLGVESSPFCSKSMVK